jgi:hypothetical protein
MRIDICYENSCDEIKIYEVCKKFPIKNLRNNFINPFCFNDNDIFNLLTYKQWDKLQNKSEYIFNVSKDWLNFISGQRSAQNKNELSLYND